MKSMAVSLFIAMSLSGCCAGSACYLDRAHVALTAADAVALDSIGKTCLAKAEACGPVGSANCPAWIACDEARKKYTAAITAIDSSLAVVNRLLADLGVGGK